MMIAANIGRPPGQAEALIEGIALLIDTPGTGRMLPTGAHRLVG